MTVNTFNAKKYRTASRYFEMRGQINAERGIEPNGMAFRKDKIASYLGSLSGWKLGGGNRDTASIFVAPKDKVIQPKGNAREVIVPKLGWVVELGKDVPVAAYFAEHQTNALGVREAEEFTVRNTPKVLYDLENTLARILDPAKQTVAVQQDLSPLYEIVDLER